MRNNSTGKSVSTLFSVLAVDSLRDLIRHRSFPLLIFLVIVADRLLRHVLNPVSVKKAILNPEWLSQLPETVFQDLPVQLSHWLFQPQALAVLGGLFLFKQLVSLWPSNSLRGWHSNRKGHQLLSSLFSLRFTQLSWDFAAICLLLASASSWVFAWFLPCRGWWLATGSTIPLWVFCTACASIAPLLMAGFSFSSKLAVLQNATAREKMNLYLNLFTRPRIMAGSWLFFSVRIILEALFVAIIPLGSLLLIDNIIVRTLLACISITPSYAYLKIATFKFFLFIYQDHAPVRQEFRDYFALSDSPVPCVDNPDCLPSNSLPAELS